MNFSFTPRSVLLATCLFFVLNAHKSVAQCPVTSVPTYASGCPYEYFTSLTAAGTGTTTSTISYSATSCTGTYFNNYSSQGIHTEPGDTISVHVLRALSTYTAYLCIFVDWNNDGFYDSTELVGTVDTFTTGGTSHFYNFRVPTTGMVSGTHLHMRLFQTEVNIIGAPCTGTYGQTVDYYIEVDCSSYPSIVAPAAAFCAGGSTTLTASGAGTGGGYSWSPATGLSGTTGASVSANPSATTIYTVTATDVHGCSSVKNDTVTVNPLPSAIAGPTSVCLGYSVTCTDATAGGSWSTSGGTVRIGATTGIVTGMTAGATNITYTSALGCTATAHFTVNAVPAAIGGTTSLCLGTASTLTDATSPGVWSSSSTGIAPIGSTSGTVTGLSVGASIITYTLPTGCYITTPATINPLPAAITGSTSVCELATATVSDATGGGTWSSSSTANATISSTGLVSGILAGLTTISYTLPTGCQAVWPMTVNPAPPSITGTGHVCLGHTATFTDPSPGGIWSTASAAVAVVGSTSGVVTSMGAGSTLISYTLAGCSRSYSTTINILPGPINGNHPICQGNSETLTDTSAGGVWISASPAVASISTSGMVSGLGAGMSVITYSLAVGCIVTSVLTVNETPAPITGPVNICLASTGTLADTSLGGSWTSSTLTVATITSAGVVSGTRSGTTTITYTLPDGCFTTLSEHINAYPPAITGSTNLCIGLASPLIEHIAGIWSSSNTGIATIDASSGAATGVSTGADTISFTPSATGCTVYTIVSVNPAPAAATGPTLLCSGHTITLSDVTPGGAWSSASPALATIGSATGVATGLSAGVNNFSYTIPNGCYALATVTVTPMPTAITGPAAACLHGTTTLTDGAAGGAWSSSPATTATIDPATGVLTGVATGTVTVVYSFGPGCSASATATVNPLPASFSMTGGGGYCVGGTGVHVGLSGSASGVTYMLYRGATDSTTTSGTGSALDFGLETILGAYTAKATIAATGCSSLMSGRDSVDTISIVIPSVSIAYTPGDTVCSGARVTLNPVPVNGGSVPAYQWKVNGASAATTTSYAYAPANGDTVKVILTSNAVCAIPDTASNMLRLTVIPSGTPAVTISAIPGDTVCRGTQVTVNATPAYGGTAPTFAWVKNGTLTTDTTTSYIYVPQNNDQVYCVLHSNYVCRLNNTDTSGNLVFTVDTGVVPVVTITTSPDSVVKQGDSVTFTATVVNGGSSPTYQWLKNGTAIAGATNATYSSTTLPAAHDSITCQVTGSGNCPVTVTQSVAIRIIPVAVSSLNAAFDVVVAPNPNAGLFTIRGTLQNANDETITLTVTDLAGRTLLSKAALAHDGILNETIQLDNVANGSYLLTVQSNSGTKVFHLAVVQ